MGKRLWSFIAFSILAVGMTFAQQTITGKVVESSTGDAVVGAGKVGLTTSSRAVKQQTWRCDTEGLGTFLVVQDIDEPFRHHLLQFVHACYVTEAMCVLTFGTFVLFLSSHLYRCCLNHQG